MSDEKIDTVLFDLDGTFAPMDKMPLPKGISEGSSSRP